MTADKFLLCPSVARGYADMVHDRGPSTPKTRKLRRALLTVALRVEREQAENRRVDS